VKRETGSVKRKAGNLSPTLILPLPVGGGGSWGGNPLLFLRGRIEVGLPPQNPPPSLWEGGGLRWGIGIFFLN